MPPVLTDCSAFVRSFLPSLLRRKVGSWCESEPTFLPSLLFPSFLRQTTTERGLGICPQTILLLRRRRRRRHSNSNERTTDGCLATEVKGHGRQQSLARPLARSAGSTTMLLIMPAPGENLRSVVVDGRGGRTQLMRSEWYGGECGLLRVHLEFRLRVHALH